LALCEAEIAQRKENRIERAIVFPVVKDLSTFDFHQVGGISKARVLELVQGGYIGKAETMILIGNRGLGKTPVATGLGMVACRQGKRVRFYGAASVVNELLVAQKELRLTRISAVFGSVWASFNCRDNESAICGLEQCVWGGEDDSGAFRPIDTSSARVGVCGRVLSISSEVTVGRAGEEGGVRVEWS
jgi:hypothetical protein